MGKNAKFGRPGALDRLRLWWHAKDRPFRVNCLLALAVGGVAAGLVAAAVAREPAPGTGLVNATRPHLTSGALPNPPVTVDIRAAGGVATPIGLGDLAPSTSSTVAATPVLPTVPAQPAQTAARPTTTATTTARVATPPDPGPQVIYTEVPVQTTATVPPLPSTTRPPPSVPATTAVTTAPPSTSPTTAITLLPPISLPPLLP